MKDLSAAGHRTALPIIVLQLLGTGVRLEGPAVLIEWFERMFGWFAVAADRPAPDITVRVRGFGAIQDLVRSTPDGFNGLLVDLAERMGFYALTPGLLPLMIEAVESVVPS